MLTGATDATIAKGWETLEEEVVLDAAALDVVARARLPHHVPFGFHGHFDEVRDR